MFSLSASLFFSAEELLISSCGLHLRRRVPRKMYFLCGKGVFLILNRKVESGISSVRRTDATRVSFRQPQALSQHCLQPARVQIVELICTCDVQQLVKSMSRVACAPRSFKKEDHRNSSCVCLFTRTIFFVFSQEDGSSYAE